MSISRTLTFFSLLLLSAAFFWTHPCAARIGIKLAGPEISAICDKSLDRQFCISFLQSTPGVSSADLKDAGLIVLDSARSEAANTENVVKSLLAKATDPKQKEAYKTCASNYDDAVDNIETAKASLSGGDYNGANIQASAAQENADTCDEGAKGSDLSNKNQHLFKVLGIVLIIANKLRGF